MTIDPPRHLAVDRVCVVQIRLRSAGNVLRPCTAFKLSLRLPPLIDGNEAAGKLKTLLEDNAPYNARVTFNADGRVGAVGATGWNAPSLAPWLASSLR